MAFDPTTAQGWQTYFTDQPPARRVFDIFCFETPDRARAAAAFAVTTATATSDVGARSFDHVEIIAAAKDQTAVEQFRRAFTTCLNEACAAVVAADRAAPLAAAVLRRVSLTPITTREAKFVEDAFLRAPIRSAILLLDTAVYASHDDGIPRPSGPVLAEDHWAPQVEALARRLLPVVQQRELYVVGRHRSRGSESSFEPRGLAQATRRACPRVRYSETTSPRRQH